MFVGVIISKNTSAGAYGVIKFIEYSFLGLFIYLNYKKLDLKKIIILLAIGIFFETSLAFFQYFNQGSLQGLLYFFGERTYNGSTPGVANASVDGNLILRPYGTFSHPNLLGGYIVICMALILSTTRRITKKLLLITGISILGIFISFSRTALTAITIYLVCFFVLSIYEKYKKGKTNKLFEKQNMFIVLFLVFTVMIFSFNLFSQRAIDLNLKDESITLRVKLLEQSLEMIKESPVFGVGINNFLNNLDQNFNSPSLIQPVHNIFFLTFAEVGIVGLISLFFILRKSIKKSPYNLILVLTIVVLGSFDHYLFTLQQGQLIFTVAISLLLSSRLSDKID